MRFAHPEFSLGFWFILALALFFIFTQRSKRRFLGKFAQQKLLERLADKVSFKKQALRLIMIVLALALSVLALMQPQWGFQWQQVNRSGLDILVAVDVSKSMLAGDVLPNRLERTKLAVKDLVKKLNGDRIGLIAFSGTAFLQCPLTVDYDGFLLVLNDLNTDTIPRGGTSLANAIKKAIFSYEGGQKKYKVLVIITDGEDHEGDPLKLAKDAAGEGIKIFCIGIGTAEGELIQLTDQNGRREFLKDKEGNVVKTRLNEKLLQQIALITDGAYVRSSGAEFGLDYIYEQRLSTMDKREISSQMNKFYYQRFQIPLSLALILLIIEPFISDLKRR